MAGTAADAIVGKFERERAAQPQQAFGIAREARARALHSIVEELQALGPAGFARRERRGLARPERI